MTSVPHLVSVRPSAATPCSTIEELKPLLHHRDHDHPFNTPQLVQLVKDFWDRPSPIVWGFSGLDSKCLETLISHAEDLRPFAYRSSTKITVNAYLEQSVDDKHGTSHQEYSHQSHQEYASGSVVPYYAIPPSSPLRTFYDNGGFYSLLSFCRGISLFPYDLPYGSVNINYMTYGDQLNPHYDFCDITLVLVLRSALAGGGFSFKQRGGDETTLSLPSGSWILMRGKEVLHRVKRISVIDDWRISVAWAACFEEGCRSTDLIRFLRYGI